MPAPREDTTAGLTEGCFLQRISAPLPNILDAGALEQAPAPVAHQDKQRQAMEDFDLVTAAAVTPSASQCASFH